MGDPHLTGSEIELIVRALEDYADATWSGDALNLLQRLKPKANPVPLTEYRVLVRGMRHLTQTVVVQAADEKSAEKEVLRLADETEFVWDESPPEDIQVEGFE